MPHTRITNHIDRTPSQVFDVIGTHVFENHPKWETEVVAIRPITPGPIRVGSQAVMVREEHGRRSETPYEVTDFEPNRLIAFRHDTAAMGFALRFELTDGPTGGTDLSVDVTMTPHGVMRIASPLIALGLPGRTRRITAQMVALVDGHLTGSASESAPSPA
jgi:hypothetical protein